MGDFRGDFLENDIELDHRLRAENTTKFAVTAFL
jgi:hypothetical protein